MFSRIAVGIGFVSRIQRLDVSLMRVAEQVHDMFA